MLLTTLYVDEHNVRLKTEKGNLVVQGPKERKRVPIETIEAVVLTGRADITNTTIGELVRRGIRISAVSRTGKLRFTIGGPTTGNVQLRVAHYRCASDAADRNQVARWIVAGKLQNQRRMMGRWAGEASSAVDRRRIAEEAETIGSRLLALPTAPDADTIRGIEGDAARRYFKAMAIHLHSIDPAFSFPRRSRRPPRDPINAALSFTYALLLTETAGAAEAAGLDPQIGFLHDDLRAGRPSLALDLVEEFRPSIADRLVARLVAKRQLRAAEHFTTGPGGAVYLSDEGRRALLQHYDQNRRRRVLHPLLQRETTIARLPLVQATLLARYLRGDLPAYPPFISPR